MTAPKKTSRIAASASAAAILVAIAVEIVVAIEVAIVATVPAFDGTRPNDRPGLVYGETAQTTPKALYLPWTNVRVTDSRLRQTQAAGHPTRAAAAATSRAQTATAAATSSPTPTLADPLTATATDLPVTTSTPTPTESPTPGETATEGPSSTPTVTAIPTGTPTPSPTPAYFPRDPSASLMPLGAAAEGTASVEWDGSRERYRFENFDESRGSTTFELDLRHPDVRAGRLTIRHVESGLFVAAGAGFFYRQADGRLVEPRYFEPTWPVTAVEHMLAPDESEVTVTVYEKLEGMPHAKRFSLSMHGVSLRIHGESLDGPGPEVGRYAGFTLGDIEGLTEAVAVRLPFMDNVPVTLVDGRTFVSTLLDAPLSHGNELVRRGPEAVPGSFTNDVAVIYGGDAIGRARAVDDFAWLTASSKIEDVFVVPPGPASPWRAPLSDKVHVLLGSSRADDRSFAEDADGLDRLARFGVVDIVAHRERWLAPESLPPLHTPADPAKGGEVGLNSLAESSSILSLSAAYTLTVPGCAEFSNPAYRDADRVTGADGAPKRIDRVIPCPDGAPSSPMYLLAPDAGLARARDDLAALHGVGVDALMLGEIPAWNPGWPWPGASDGPLDLAVSPRHPATIGEAITAMLAGLDQLQREGPVFAAGAYGPADGRYDTFLGGALDGALRSPSTSSFDPYEAGDNAPVVPDMVLRVVRPLVAHIGAGTYARFFGAAMVWPIGEAQLDAYLATTLAYGHAGMWEADAISESQAVKHYHIVRPLQRLMLGAADVSVSYAAADGVERDLSSALKDGLDLAGPRLHLRFIGEETLEIWINHGRNVWPVERRGESWLLPADGWIVEAGGTQGYSALAEGRRVDFLRTPDYTLMDGRGEETTFERASAKNLVIRFADGRVVEERDDGRLEVVGP